MPFCRPCVALGEAGMDGWTCQVELLKAIREQRQQMDLKDEQLEASASMQYKLALAKSCEWTWRRIKKESWIISKKNWQGVCLQKRPDKIADFLLIVWV